MAEKLTFDAAETALVVVDMQNDFCEPEGFYGKAGMDISGLMAPTAPLAALLGRAREAGMTVVFTRIVREKGEAAENQHKLLPKRWFSFGERLMRGSWGAEVVDPLCPREGELIVDKIGYSSFEGTTLERDLKERGVTTILLTGVVTYACVLATGFAAFDKGFDVALISDAAGSWNEGLGNATGEIVDLLMGRTLRSDEIQFTPRREAAA